MGRRKRDGPPHGIGGTPNLAGPEEPHKAERALLTKVLSGLLGLLNINSKGLSSSIDCVKLRSSGALRDSHINSYLMFDRRQPRRHPQKVFPES